MALFAIFYFGVGRLLYCGAPILIAWGIGLIAALRKNPSALHSTCAPVLASPLSTNCRRTTVKIVGHRWLQKASSGLLQAQCGFHRERHWYDNDDRHRNT